MQEIRQGVEREGIAFVEQGQRFNVDLPARPREHEQGVAGGWEVRHSIAVVGPSPFIPTWVGPAFALEAAAVV